MDGDSPVDMWAYRERDCGVKCYIRQICVEVRSSIAKRFPMLGETLPNVAH